MTDILTYIYSPATVPPSALEVTITPTGTVNTGDRYQLDCIATLTVEGIDGEPQLLWVDPMGVLIHGNTGDISSGPPMVSGNSVTLPLVFSLLRPEHSGTYTCRVTVHSVSTGDVIGREATSEVDVQCKDGSFYMYIVVTRIHTYVLLVFLMRYVPHSTLQRRLI